MKKTILLLSCVLLASLLPAQIPVRPFMHDQTYVSPEYNAAHLLDTAGFDTKTLFEMFDQTMDSVFSISPLVGYSVGVMLPGDIVYLKSVGSNSAAPSDLLTPEMAMGIGSATKMFTGTVMLQLETEGILSLGDSLHTWLPPFQNVDSTITIRQLLNHTSGIYNFTDNLLFLLTGLSDLGHIWTPAEVMSFVKEPLFAAGTDWFYSNTNYLLASLIIEEATGKPYEQVVRERIVAPLGLEHTFSYLSNTASVPVAHLWYDIDFDGEKEDLQGMGLSLNAVFTGVTGAGNIMCNPKDLAFFVKKLVNGDLLAPAAQAQMFTFDSIAVNSETAAEYGLGVTRRTVLGLPMFGHNGYVFYQTRAYYLPGEDIAIVLMSNDGNDSAQVVGVDDMFVSLVSTWLDFKVLSAATGPSGDWDWAVQVFPSPASDRITFLFEKLAFGQLTLVSPDGMVVFSEKLEGVPQREFSVTRLSSGIYFWKFLSENGGAASGKVPLIKGR